MNTSSMKQIFGSPARKKISSEEEGHWMSVSDLMAGLMIVFLFIAIALMQHYIVISEDVKEKLEQIQKIIDAYEQNKATILIALTEEFEKDLKEWNAEIDPKTLSFLFKSPDTLFERGKKEIRPEFKKVLDDFFPRYYKILSIFSDSISEVRIEGHTSSEWFGNPEKDNFKGRAYFLNMALSQDRTRSVLEYVYQLKEMQTHSDWIKENIAAVGFSSSKLIKKNGLENKPASRRVTFRLITKAEEQIEKILKQAR